MAEAKRPLRVFICHSSGDKPIVRELHQRLDSEGWIDAWLDEEKLYPGHERNLEIEKAVEEADAILVCLTKDSVTEEGPVQRELRKVLGEADTVPEGAIFIIPVRLEECEIPRELRLWQCADYFPRSEREAAYQRLLVSLRKRAIAVGITTAETEPGSKEPSQMGARTKTRSFMGTAKSWFEQKNSQMRASQFINFTHNWTWLLLFVILLCASSVLFRWPSFLFPETSPPGGPIPNDASPEIATVTPATETPVPEPAISEPPVTESPVFEPPTETTEPPATEPPTEITEPPATDSPLLTCNTSMESQLLKDFEPGKVRKAKVLIDNPNVRSDSSRRANVKNITIRINSEVEITGNPVCEPWEDSAYLWWPIKFQGKEGWLAEMPLNVGGYHLEPIL